MRGGPRGCHRRSQSPGAGSSHEPRTPWWLVRLDISLWVRRRVDGAVIAYDRIGSDVEMSSRKHVTLLRISSAGFFYIINWSNNGLVYTFYTINRWLDFFLSVRVSLCRLFSAQHVYENLSVAHFTHRNFAFSLPQFGELLSQVMLKNPRKNIKRSEK